MKKIFKIIVLILVTNLTLSTNAQKKNKIFISGIVTNSLENPVSNVLIFVDNIKQEKKTNTNGSYSLILKKEPIKLTFLSLSYGSVDIAYVKGKNNINVVFENKESLVTNQTPIKDEENPNKSNQFRNIFEYLSGRPGIEINNNNIRIRGVTSLSSSTEPLFIVNGKQETSANVISINPSDIKKLKVLKTADELSIYGIRGGNGVIVIDTY